MRHWLASGTLYGYRKIILDLRDAGNPCSRHPVLLLMKAEGLRPQGGYDCKPRHAAAPWAWQPNVLNQDFAPKVSNKVWVMYITYIRA
jgi:putative transposase